jgi:hypothetical protein
MPVRPITPSPTPEPEPTTPAAVANPLAKYQGGASPEQQVWHQAENVVRNLVRAPKRIGPSMEFFQPTDTSDQLIVDMTARLVTRWAADSMMLSTERVKDIYARETEDIIAKAPETFVYAGTELLDENLVHTLGESLHWLSQSYGDEYVAPWLQTYMINDNVSAAKTRAVLEQTSAPAAASPHKRSPPISCSASWKAR